MLEEYPETNDTGAPGGGNWTAGARSGWETFPIDLFVPFGF